MKLDPTTVNDLALGFQPSSYLRVMPSAHMATPPGMVRVHPVLKSEQYVSARLHRPRYRDRGLVRALNSIGVKIRKTR